MATSKSSTQPGHEFGFLTVLEVIPRSRKDCTNQKAICRCVCGVVKTYVLQTIRNGGTKSCGCKRGSLISSANRTHGKTDSRAYRIWHGMKNRCLNAKDPVWLRYGGRGIKVCARWLASFENFFADMGDPPGGMSLDRIDPNGDYSPDNCRWASDSTQASNRTTCRYVSVDGEVMTISQAARKLGVSHQTVSNRVLLGRMTEVVRP